MAVGTADPHESAATTAFVLSGGANLGSLQAGMLVALFERGIRPDLMVGTSIGAANAAYIAADPTLERARALCQIWSTVRSRDVFPVNPLRALRALTRGGAMFSPTPMRRLFERELGYDDIEEARVPLRIVATRFADGSESVLESGSVVDAILASTALPAVFPPYEIDGELYLDGGLSDHIPLQPAVAAGATRIYVLSVGFPCPPPVDDRSPLSMLAHSIGILLSQRIRVHSADLFAQPGLEVIQIPPVCTEVGLRDLSRAAVLIDEAREQTRRFLAGEPCSTCHHDHHERGKGGMDGGIPVPALQPAVPVRNGVARPPR